MLCRENPLVTNAYFFIIWRFVNGPITSATHTKPQTRKEAVDCCVEDFAQGQRTQSCLTIYGCLVMAQGFSVLQSVAAHPNSLYMEDRQSRRIIRTQDTPRCTSFSPR